MTYFFTADQHFGHENLVTKISDRPFSSIKEMDEKLIELWNSVVKPGDLVYHLGDFSWIHPSLYADRLNGQKQLIKGNHDRYKDLIYKDYFVWIGYYKYSKIAGQHMVLSHYPMISWEGKHSGSWQLFGHCHNSIKPRLGQCDVGVDGWEFRPISFEELCEYFSNQSERIESAILNPTPCNEFKCGCNMFKGYP